MRSLGEPYNTVTYPGVRDSIFMTDFRAETNKWVCDCGIGLVVTFVPCEYLYTSNYTAFKFHYFSYIIGKRLGLIEFPVQVVH